MAHDKPTFTVTIPSHLAYVCAVCACVGCFCKAHGLDDSTIARIVLAAYEAITNIVRHAHHHDDVKPIKVICEAHPDRIEIHVLDEGDLFDLTQVPQIDPGEVREGGRGVFLMRTLMEQLHCEPRSGGGNHLRLVKFCTPRPPG